MATKKKSARKSGSRNPLLPAVANDKRMQKVIRRVRYLMHFWRKQSIEMAKKGKYQTAADFENYRYALACLEPELHDIDKM